MENSVPMKSVSEALFIRNKIISNYERAINIADLEKRKALMNVVIVGEALQGWNWPELWPNLGIRFFQRTIPSLTLII